MKFIHGMRTELKYHEMTPLDKAIDGYIKKAENYCKKKREIDNLHPDVRKKRESELEADKHFLEQNTSA